MKVHAPKNYIDPPPPILVKLKNNLLFVQMHTVQIKNMTQDSIAKIIDE